MIVEFSDFGIFLTKNKNRKCSFGFCVWVYLPTTKHDKAKEKEAENWSLSSQEAFRTHSNLSLSRVDNHHSLSSLSSTVNLDELQVYHFQGDQIWRNFATLAKVS